MNRIQVYEGIIIIPWEFQEIYLLHWISSLIQEEMNNLLTMYVPQSYQYFPLFI